MALIARYENGTEVEFPETRPRDIVAYEKQSKQAYDGSYTANLRCMYLAGKRTGVIENGIIFENWVDSLESTRPADGDEDEGPFEGDTPSE